MQWIVFYITTAYFLLGALGVFFINRKKGDGKERWRKFFIFALIVYGVENAILAKNPFPYLCAAILLAGLNELVQVWRRNERGRTDVLLIGLLSIVVIGYGFFEFSRLDISLMQLYIFLVVLTFDGFSQVTGQLIGRTRFAGRISPNKTLEGSAGGVLMALLTAYLLHDHFNVGLPYLLALTAVLCAIALAGDLLASWYKRLNHAKDYSNLIPGHGGMLDRFDSFIVVGAAWWVAQYFEWV